VRPAKPFNCSASMAVCTAYFTFGDLGRYPFPSPSFAYQVADISFLLASYVIEL